jgi:hypothetical protein
MEWAPEKAVSIQAYAFIALRVNEAHGSPILSPPP